jgi:hypothetical protein
MKDVCFTSVCFGDRRYCDQQLRLKKSILNIYPEANLNFYYDRVPASAKSFITSLYGFKVHAINETRTLGFKKVIWLDPAMILEREVDWQFLEYPMIAVKDDNKLANLISEQCLDYYSLTREQLLREDWRLVGGSLYYFDFTKQIAEDIFLTWYNAEKEGLFGSQAQAASEQIQGHRNDESCMAVAMYLNGVMPQGGGDVGYCVEKNPIFKKIHFK